MPDLAFILEDGSGNCVANRLKGGQGGSRETPYGAALGIR